VEEVVWVPRGKALPPRVVPPLAMNPGMWLNMVNVKTPYLVDLEIESMKNLFWSVRDRYAQKCPRQLLHSMQQFVLEEHLEIMCSEAGEEMEDFMPLARDEFIAAMLRMHAANSSRKWRLLIKNTKIRSHSINLRPICAGFSVLDECSGSHSSFNGQRNR